MAQRLVTIPDIGEVVLSKRRGSTNMRLSVNAKGQVRVGMPYWAPYEAGVMFARSKKAWIISHIGTQAPKILENGSKIGKAHHLYFQNSLAKNGVADARISATSIQIITPLDHADPRVQEKANQAAEKALKKESEQLLPIRLRSIAQRFSLSYKGLKIRKLTSRWGSCSSKGSITLSYFLIQLPWELIDYVILHELAHTKIHNHSKEFWDYMEMRVPNLKELRRDIKAHKPRVEPL